VLVLLFLATFSACDECDPGIANTLRKNLNQQQLEFQMEYRCHKQLALRVAN